MSRLFENFYEENVGFRFRAKSCHVVCRTKNIKMANPSSFPRNMSSGFRVNKKGLNKELLPRV
jgi:hypothetical protein